MPIAQQLLLSTVRHEALLSRTCAALLLVVSTLILTGWTAALPTLTSFVPGLTATNPVTAIGFILCAASLWLCPCAAENWMKWMGRGFGLAVLGLGTFGVLRYTAPDRVFALDEFVFSSRLGGNRMAPNTAALFVCIGIPLSLSRSHSERLRKVAIALLVPSLYLSLAALLGYLFGADELYHVAGQIPMALPTAVAFFVASAGALACHSNGFVERILRERSAGSLMMRQLLLPLFLLPLVIGWLRLEGEKAGLYGTNFGVSVMVTVGSALGLAFLVRAATALDRLEEQRVQAEAKRRASDQLFRDIADTIQEVFWSVSLGSSGRKLLYVSPAYETVWGRTVSELHRDPDAWTTAIVPEDRERVRNAAMSDLVSGEYDETYRIQRPDGSIRWIRDRGFRASGGSDGCHRVVGLAQDITDSKIAEEALAEESRLAGMSADVAFQLTHASCSGECLQKCSESVVRHLKAACARIWELEREDGILQLKATAGSPPHLDAQHSRIPLGHMAIGGIARSGQPLLSNEVHHHDQICDPEWTRREGIVGFAGFPLLTEKAVIGVLAVFSRTPFSEPQVKALEGLAGALSIGIQRRRAEEALQHARDVAEKASRAKSEFLSRMSHELRTPLNAILGFGQLLELEEQQTPAQKESVDQILRAGRHLLNLINEVLDISRIEAGALTLSPEPVGIRETVEDLVALLQPTAARANVTWHIRSGLDPELCVLADQQKLKQVLLNLMTNAIKYNRPGGRALIWWEESTAERVRILVADEGAGIEKSKLERLFTAFDRLGAEMSTVEGTGLGLALSRRLCEAMRGTVRVLATSGEGTTFAVELPRATLPALPQPALSTPSPDHPSDGELLVLYVEDNASNLRLMERALGHRPNARLLTAVQGEAGFELACRTVPDLILLDLHLPDMRGSDLLKRLKADSRTCNTPVIVISADASPGQIDQVVSLGAAGYLTKPININKLIRLVNSVAKGE